jgi:hypothetical protein
MTPVGAATFWPPRLIAALPIVALSQGALAVAGRRIRFPMFRVLFSAIRRAQVKQRK